MLTTIVKETSRLAHDVYSYPCFKCIHSSPRFCIYRGRKCANSALRYRGVYATYEEALAAIPSHRPTGFNLEDVTEFFLETQCSFNPSDYPVLLRLLEILRTGDRVFDFGGGFGQSYYAYRNYLRFPPGVQWQVCDVEAFTRLGSEVAEKRGVDSLSFTNDSHDGEGASVLLTNGALHYIESDLSQILSGLTVKPAHVLVNRIPTYDGEPYYTVQNGYRSYIPHKVMNTAKFLHDMEALGYNTVDQWSMPRTLSVPFHPERFVPSYNGFYFARTRSLARAVEG